MTEQEIRQTMRVDDYVSGSLSDEDLAAFDADEHLQQVARHAHGLEDVAHGTHVEVGAVGELPREVLGLQLEWVRWGGSSDANVAAAVGAPQSERLDRHR